MLYGEFSHTVDAKNRMFVPAKYREELGETFVIFRSIRGNYIKMLSLGEWENYIAPIKALPRKDAEATLQKRRTGISRRTGKNSSYPGTYRARADREKRGYRRMR